MGYIDITRIILSPSQSVNRNVTLEYKLDSDPDLPENWIYVNNVLVPPSGFLTPVETILGLEEDTAYTLRATTDCGSASYTETVNTPNYNLIIVGSGDYVMAMDTFHNGLVTSLTVDGKDMSKTIKVGGSEGFPIRASIINSNPEQFNFAGCAYTTNDNTIDVVVGVDVNGETGLYLKSDGHPDVYTPTTGNYTLNNLPAPFPMTQEWAPFVTLYKDENFTTTTTSTSTTSTTSTSTTSTTTTEAIIECDSSASYSGGESYPTENIIYLGTGTGIVTLNYNALSVPDKFIVIFDGVEVINTGYRGDADQQDELDAALAARGEPLETIAGIGSGSVSFNKTTATTTAIVKVFAPIGFTVWDYTLSCPLLPINPLRAVIGYNNNNRYCNYNSFPNTYYGKYPFDGNIYSDSAATILAPAGIFIDTIGAVDRYRIKYWTGSNIENTQCWTDKGTVINTSSFTPPGSYSSPYFVGYVPAGKTLRYTFTATSLSSFPPAQWRVEGTDAGSDLPVTITSPAQDLFVGSQIVVDIPRNTCDSVMLTARGYPTSGTTDPAYSITYRVKIELL